MKSHRTQTQLHANTHKKQSSGEKQTRINQLTYSRYTNPKCCVCVVFFWFFVLFCLLLALFFYGFSLTHQTNWLLSKCLKDARFASYLFGCVLSTDCDWLLFSDSHTRFYRIRLCVRLVLLLSLLFFFFFALVFSPFAFSTKIKARNNTTKNTTLCCMDFVRIYHVIVHQMALFHLLCKLFTSLNHIEKAFIFTNE